MSGDLEAMSASKTPDEPARPVWAAAIEPGPDRRPYRAPRLVEYGRLTDVTRFGGSEIVDSGAGLGQAPG